MIDEQSYPFYHGFQFDADVFQSLERDGDFLFQAKPVNWSSRYRIFLVVKTDGENYRLLVRKSSQGYVNCAKQTFISMQVMLDTFTANPFEFEGKKHQLKRGIERGPYVIYHADIKFQKKVNCGSFGTIYTALMKKSGQLVATKRIEIADSSTDENKLMVSGMLQDCRRMIKLDHPNVLKFFGFVVDRDPYLVVTEICNGGSLEDMLRKRADLLELETRIDFCAQLAAGLEYLHSQSVFLNGIAARHVLFHKGLVKFANYSMCRPSVSFREDPDKPSRPMSVCWLAPEAWITSHHQGFPVDIYAFSILLWEMFTVPYEPPFHLQAPFQVKKLVQDGGRPPVPALMPKELSNIMVQAWSQYPQYRPNAQEIKKSIDQINKCKNPRLAAKREDAMKHREYKYKHDEIEIKNELSLGAFGTVYECLLKRNGNRVLVRRIDTSGIEDALLVQEMLEQAALMKAFKHENVAIFHGFVIDRLPYLLITEFCDSGTIEDLLKRLGKLLDVKLRVDMSYQVSDGLNYLHSLDFLHRDLATRNCLLIKGAVKLVHYGMCRPSTVYKVNLRDPRKALNVRWMAPEMWKTGVADKSSDIYSYGILLWELFAVPYETPYNTWNRGQIMEQVAKGYRMTRPIGMPGEVGDLMNLAWSQESEQRPASNEIKECMLMINRLHNSKIVATREFENEKGAFKMSQFDFAIKKEISLGSFGTVYQAIRLRTNTTVMITRIDVDTFTPDMECLAKMLREAKQMVQLQHKNVLAFYGFVVDRSPYFAAFELCIDGTVEDVLKQKGWKLEPEIRIDLIAQTAAGLKYLHTRNIIVGEVSTRNCLLSNGVVKLANYGMCKPVTSYKANLKNPKPPLRVHFMAPELWLSGRLSFSSDVFSFAVFIYEIYTIPANAAYFAWKDEWIKSKVATGFRMPRPEDMPDDIGELMESAWSQDLEKRPVASQIKKDMEEMNKKVNEELVLRRNKQMHDGKSYNMKHSDIAIQKELKWGAFGTVYLCSLKNDNLVCAKRIDGLRVDADSKTVAVLLPQANIMNTFEHRNIAKFCGFVVDRKPYFVIFEYCASGNLEDLLTKQGKQLEIGVRVDFCAQVAAGLEYLHSKEFIHGDVSTKNCLLSKGVVKLADYGMCCPAVAYKNDLKRPDPPLNVRWQAPELWRTGKATLASDIYSFGILLWEMFYIPYDHPHGHYSYDRVKIHIISNGRLDRPSEMPKEVGKVMCAAWDEIVKKRPPAGEIRKELDEINKVRRQTGIDEDYYGKMSPNGVCYFKESLSPRG